MTSQYNEDDAEPLQLELYGVKVRITPRAPVAPYDDWRTVWLSAQRDLREIVANTLGLVGDILKAARSVVRGIGALPPALAKR